MPDYVVSVIVNVLPGDDVEKTIRKIIKPPVIKGGNGELVHVCFINQFLQMKKNAKKYEMLKNLILDMIEQ